MLLTNISRLVTIENGVIENAALQIIDDRIAWLGPQKGAPMSRDLFDCKQAVVTPGLIDCHTHLVHADYRQKEFAFRASGKTYLEIAEEGGGILSTVAATRRASVEDLYAQTAKRLKEAMSCGTTTIEIKTGYGLDLETELKMLEVISRLKKHFQMNIVATFLGAHVVPKEYGGRRQEYVEKILKEILPAVAKTEWVKFCDVFVEEGAFTAEEARAILEEASLLGLKPKLHADQFNNGKGAQLAAQCQAVSADHLEKISARGIAALKKSGTVAVLLPGASFFVGVKPAPARKLLDAGVCVALATDYNPGTNPCLNLMLTATVGMGLFKMTTDEVWKAITLNAAKGLDLEETVGSLRKGKQADLVLWDAPDEIYPLYRYSQNCVKHLFVKGKQVL